MLPSPEPACLVIADISGYTGYVAGVELDHAQDILADLIDAVVKALRPPFRLAKLEGDAAFAYVLTETVDASLLQDAIEATYFAFRRRQRDIGRATQCECDACAHIPTLDLKFVVHHGLVARQKVAGRDELVGRDVILVHRLLKNSAGERLGGHAYALYTDACVRAMQIDPQEQGLIEHRETVDIIGEVVAWLRDLEAAWREEQQRTRIELTADEASLVFAREVPLPRQTVWEFITLPGRRKIWSGADAILENRPKGRRGAGAVNHCMHGKDAILEEVLDWRPYDYLTTRDTLPMPGVPKMLMTDAFIELPDGGTRLEFRIGAADKKQRAAFEQMLPGLQPMFEAMGEALVGVLLAQASSPAVSHDEPALPPSAARYADAPAPRPVPPA